MRNELGVTNFLAEISIVKGKLYKTTERTMQSKKVQKKAMIKASILVTFIISAVIVVRFTPIRGVLTADKLGYFLETTGFWAPLVFMMVYTVGVCLFVPGTVLGAMGA